MQFSGPVFSGNSPPRVHTAQKAHSVSSTDSEGSVVPEAGSESRASYPLRSRERVRTPSLLEFESQLPLPRASSESTSRKIGLALATDSAGLVHFSRTTIHSRLVPTQTLTQSRPRTRVHGADTRIRTQGAATPPGPKEHTRREPDTPRARRSPHMYYRSCLLYTSPSPRD